MAILPMRKMKLGRATAASVKARSTTVIEPDDAQHELTASIDWVTGQPVMVGPEPGRVVLEVEYGVENLFPRPAILGFLRMRNWLVLRRVDESPDRSA